MSELADIYIDLHQHPELSKHEERTAGVAAAALKAAGYTVTEHIGGYGVIGVLRNGEGPTVWLRADMDALPVKEETGLSYASTVTATNADGETVPVAHACGHDMHTTALIGAAGKLADEKSQWSGTVVAVFQPAEEDLSGAQSMLDDGLLNKAPHPDVVLGQHVAPGPAGMVFYHPDYTLAASDALQIRLFGKGGHGSRPEATVDPVLMAAMVIVRLQSIVSRETAVRDQVVVTVGVVEAGTKNNIIPDDATLQLSIRTFDRASRERVLASITRIVNAEAVAAGAQQAPEITTMYAGPATHNDEVALNKVIYAFNQALPGRVMEVPPGSGSEDFGRLGAAAGVPSVFWFLGGADPTLFAPPADLMEVLDRLPSNHSPEYAPVIEPTLSTGVEALVTAAKAWLADGA